VLFRSLNFVLFPELRDPGGMKERAGERRVR